MTQHQKLLSFNSDQQLILTITMESISNAAAAVGRVVGLTGEEDNQKPQQTQSGSEPLSGVKGRGTAEEPYDGGNQEGQLPT